MSILFHNSLHVFVYIYHFVTTFWHVYVKPRCTVIRRIYTAVICRVNIWERVVRFELTNAISYLLLLPSWISGLNLVLIFELISLNKMLNDSLGSVLRAIFSVFKTIFSSMASTIIIRTDYFYADI